MSCNVQCVAERTEQLEIRSKKLTFLCHKMLAQSYTHNLKVKKRKYRDSKPDFSNRLSLWLLPFTHFASTQTHNYREVTP